MSLISVINMQSVAGFGSGSHRGDGVIEEGEPRGSKKRRKKKREGRGALEKRLSVGGNERQENRFV